MAHFIHTTTAPVPPTPPLGWESATDITDELQKAIESLQRVTLHVDIPRDLLIELRDATEFLIERYESINFLD